MAATRVYVNVHLDGDDACAFHVTGQGPGAFASITLVGTDVVLYANTVDLLDQLAVAVTQARRALAVRQLIETDLVPA